MSGFKELPGTSPLEVLSLARLKFLIYAKSWLKKWKKRVGDANVLDVGKLEKIMTRKKKFIFLEKITRLPGEKKSF